MLKQGMVLQAKDNTIILRKGNTYRVTDLDFETNSYAIGVYEYGKVWLPIAGLNNLFYTISDDICPTCLKNRKSQFEMECVRCSNE